ncbi:MAG TPA: ABC transporter substrate-binding protein, partial [Vicinamibacterales bacterium]|nr:ABC transporter substrate-binding protein [Vicinamibacterales bacterium]
LKIGVAAPPAGVRSRGVVGIADYLVSEGFVAIGWDGRPVARLASSWDWLADGSVRFRLRAGATFHDGSPLNADAVRTILTRHIEQNRESAVSFESVTGLERGVDETLIVRLSRPEPFLLADLADASLNHPGDASVGSGPYRLTHWDEKGQVAKLEAFEGYYRGAPEIKSIELLGYEQQRSAWAALLRGEINAVHEINPGSVGFVQASSGVRTFPFVRPYFIELAFNLRHPVLRRPDVRRALGQAVDRSTIIRVGLNGRGVPAEGPIWPFHWAYAPAPQRYTYDPEAALVRFDLAELPVRPSAGRDRMPARFRFTCLTVPDARYEKLATVLQRQLYEVGVDMAIEVLPLDALVARLRGGTFDAYLLERSSGRSLNWTYLGFHSRYSFTGYRAADGALDRMRTAANDTETRSAVADFQHVLYEDPPAIFLAWPQVARAVSTAFVVPDEEGRDIIGSISQWRPAASRR